jgi:hypothetical protein
MKGTPDLQAVVYHTFNIKDLIETGHSLRGGLASRLMSLGPCHRSRLP